MSQEIFLLNYPDFSCLFSAVSSERSSFTLKISKFGPNPTGLPAPGPSFQAGPDSSIATNPRAFSPTSAWLFDGYQFQGLLSYRPFGLIKYKSQGLLANQLWDVVPNENQRLALG